MDVLLVGAVGLGGLYAIAKSEKESKNKEAMKTIDKFKNKRVIHQQICIITKYECY